MYWKVIKINQPSFAWVCLNSFKVQVYQAKQIGQNNKAQIYLRWIYLRKYALNTKFSCLNRENYNFNHALVNGKNHDKVCKIDESRVYCYLWSAFLQMRYLRKFQDGCFVLAQFCITYQFYPVERKDIANQIQHLEHENYKN